MFINKIEHNTCPYCANILNAVGSDIDDSPQTGDISICGHCGEISMFEDCQLVAVSDKEKETLKQYLTLDQQNIQCIIQSRYKSRMKYFN